MKVPNISDKGPAVEKVACQVLMQHTRHSLQVLSILTHVRC